MCAVSVTIPVVTTSEEVSKMLESVLLRKIMLHRNMTARITKSASVIHREDSDGVVVVTIPFRSTSAMVSGSSNRARRMLAISSAAHTWSRHKRCRSLVGLSSGAVDASHGDP